MAVVLALASALLFALAAAAEQRAASRVLRPPASARWARPSGARPLGPGGRLLLRTRRGLRQAVTLVRSPLWIAGWGADGLGFSTQAGAVHLGSLSVVQPLLVTTLLFSLPLAAVGGRQRPRWADWLAAAAACSGLALVLSGRRPAAATASVSQSRLVSVALLLVLAAAALVALGRARGGRGQAVPLSVAAGMMFALGAAFTKLVTESLASRGAGGTIGYWPAYALLAVSLTGLVLQQVAFSAGSLPATMTAITLTDPLVSYGLGVGVFGEHAPRGTGAVLAFLVGLALISGGVSVLARSPLLRRPAGPAPAAPTAAPGAALGASDAALPATARARAGHEPRLVTACATPDGRKHV